MIKPWAPGTTCDVLLALAQADVGVTRNGGRLGARWAPQALVSALAKLSLPQNPGRIQTVEVSTQGEETEDFVKAQRHEEERLTQTLACTKKLIHLGGGHDHVLPLLRTLGHSRPVVVLNIDAHCDTRQEVEPHSGNPFRLFAHETKHDFQLHQIGIHPFANSLTTLAPLKKGSMHVLYRQDCDDEASVASFLARLQASIPDNAVLVFSLDCDALAASDVAAVSAPNHHGLSLSFVHALVRWYAQWCAEQGQRGFYGVYEFNPVYDTVSGQSARALAGLLYEMVSLTE